MVLDTQNCRSPKEKPARKQRVWKGRARGGRDRVVANLGKWMQFYFGFFNITCMTGFDFFSLFLMLEQSTVFLYFHPACRPQSWAVLLGADVLAAPIYCRLKQVFNHPRQRGLLLFQTRSRLWNGRLIRNKNGCAPIKLTVLWQNPGVLGGNFV